jgi:hypothetical protein
MVWQWQRDRDHRRRGTRGRVAPSAAPERAASDPGLRPPSPMADPAFVAGLRPIPSGPLGAGAAVPARDISGVDPTGGPADLVIAAFDRPVLLAFLHTRCDGCDEFWRGFRDSSVSELPPVVSAAVLTKGPGSVSSAEVRQAALGVSRVPVIMSDAAWADYRVTGYPFFVLVDPATRTVTAETVGFGWSDVGTMIRSSGY